MDLLEGFLVSLITIIIIFLLMFTNIKQTFISIGVKRDDAGDVVYLVKAGDSYKIFPSSVLSKCFDIECIKFLEEKIEHVVASTPAQTQTPSTSTSGIASNFPQERIVCKYIF